MNDIDIINRFKEQISWADKTRLLAHGERIFLETDHTVYIPLRWNHVILQELAVLQAYFKRRMTALVWGDPSELETVRLCWVLMGVGFGVTFIDAVASVAYSCFVVNSLDGLDWQRSLEAVARDGVHAKSIYQWEG